MEKLPRIEAHFLACLQALEKRQPVEPDGSNVIIGEPDESNVIIEEPVEGGKPIEDEPKPAVDLSDGNRDIRQMIESRGFGVEEHKVTTDDGFNLTLFRMINPKDKVTWSSSCPSTWTPWIWS